MCVGMIETRSLKILLKGFHENYSDLLKKQHGISEYIYVICRAYCREVTPKTSEDRSKP